MPKVQTHCKLHDFYAWAVPKNVEKLTKNRPKNAQQGPPKRIFKFYHLFSHPEKAMLSNHHSTASPEWANALVPPTPLGRYHGKAGAKPWKAAAERFRVLRGAQNVPRGSFEA